jgi:ABC-type iron transport system FetAB permease component
MSVVATVQGMLAELSEKDTHETFRACLTSGSDDAMKSCARAGIREAMIERVKESSHN